MLDPIVVSIHDSTVLFNIRNWLISMSLDRLMVLSSVHVFILFYSLNIEYYGLGRKKQKQNKPNINMVERRIYMNYRRGAG